MKTLACYLYTAGSDRAGSTKDNSYVCFYGTLKRDGQWQISGLHHDTVLVMRLPIQIIQKRN